ncbi:hypothetical protein P3X46_013065 [Hevea brasiliensis]|uniref:Beta-glucosidase n=1 Tax=Hevea brasiliensis TaxID=3981 RepID=A0ABQ9M2C1_HEVBR|nr:hypothetical protein P3X46_013065 [Hevea brasiliensis]
METKGPFILLCLLATSCSLVTCSYGAKPNRLMPFNRSSFPEDFIFGAGSSAYQTEGAALIDGKGPSIWDIFVKEHPEKIVDRSTGEVADDFYHHYKEDIKLMKKIGLDSFRFSISWSRVLPKGKISGGVNPLGVKFYNNLINLLLANGIKPFVTLFHFDTPQALEDDYAGFLSPKILYDYLDYADFCFKTFGDRVKFWVTFNQPNIFATNAYNSGTFAPGRCSKYAGNCTAGNSATEPYIAVHHQLLCHAAAVKLYREKYKAIQKGQIGITTVTHWFTPKYNTTSSKRAAYRGLDFFFGWVADPITFGDYPQSMKEFAGNRLPKFTKEQSNMLKAEKHGKPIGTPTALDWLYIYPKGLQELLVYIKENYNDPIISINENGMPDSDSLLLKVALKDGMRIRYHSSHLSSILKAIKVGVKVKAYYVWAFHDNFEWGHGYTVRFGIVYVDYKNNQKRYLKYSAYWFKKFLLN